VSALDLVAVGVVLGGRVVLDSIDLTVEHGASVAIVGPNGAGKSTLLRAIVGFVRHSGAVHIDGRDASHLGRRERARLIALVPQAPVVPSGMTLGEYVLLGRTPHLAPLAAEGAADIEAAHWALAELDLLTLARRPLDQVSGGERQRAFLARALAQAAPLVLLDEPTTALDIGHQQEVLELIDRLRASRGITVVTTMHDLTLAGQYAQRLVLLDAGRIVVDGEPAAVVTEANLSRYYGAHVEVVDGRDGPVVVPVRGRWVAPGPAIEERLA
jgi:iron complex transport system ATP-binding protein